MALNSEIKIALEALYASDWQDVSVLSPVAAREQSKRFAELRKFPQALPKPAISDFTIAAEEHQNILLRHYQPATVATNAVIVFYHGGGYVLGNVEQYDPACRWMADELQTPVISVDYRLAPEHPFPAQIEDGYAALEWVAAHREKLGMKDAQLVVAGDSAGAHLAAMVSILARDRKGPAIAWQWLMYPWVDNNFSRSSYHTYAEGYGLSTAGMQWFDAKYLADGKVAAYPAYPLQVQELGNLPPAFVVVAECDVLHDEGVEYIQKLESAGNKVFSHYAEGMIHGFLNLYPVAACFNASRKMFTEFKKYLRT